MKGSAILTGSGSHKTRLTNCLAPGLLISKGEKANTINTKEHVAILKHAKVNSDSMLMWFIKVDKSKVLKREKWNTKKRIR